MSFISKFFAGLRAFREAYVTSDLLGLDITSINQDDYNSADARRLRYSVSWASYENTVYRRIHNWAIQYLTTYALYKYIRGIYNPSYRLGEFWKSHLWGGVLNLDAGTLGALPIITKNERIRPFIGQVWKWSNWAIEKDVVSLHGSVLGDTIIKVVDDITDSRVYFDVIHPGTISELAKDARGNIKGYVIEYQTADPISKRPVTYKEVAMRDGQDVIYQTFNNGSPCDWGNGASEWSMPYGFIPMVHIQHNNVGLDWGWNEFHPARSKVHEADDLASMVSDQIRKGINPRWLFSGMTKGEGNKTITGRTAQSDSTGASTDRKEPGREETGAMYASDPNAKANALVANVNLEGAISHILEILKEIERDYPELKFDALRSSGDVSGKALRIARQPAETKVIQRRANYDNGLVRANQMALAIGGMRGYFRGINLDSFQAGKLDHSIGSRPVFHVDEIDQLEEQAQFWETAKSAKEAGYPLQLFLEDAGWEQVRILKFINTSQGVMLERNGRDDN